ncbi:MAG TPA: hypothetical protein VD713_06755 [Sphingomonadales bacterium]|nr:hypothetical protein [Sphingomonadales bacterium]
MAILFIWQISSRLFDFSVDHSALGIPIDDTLSSIILTVIVIILFVAVGTGLMKRRRWGWVFLLFYSSSLALFSLDWASGFLAAVSAYYAWKRWGEFNPVLPGRKK